MIALRYEYLLIMSRIVNNTISHGDIFVVKDFIYFLLDSG